ncbi:MAG: polymer-forming cytoskeletal protein [Desulfarculales bacterium]|jgi:cytoskeletal protein CcmA (bactofilin family)|nr:polymer-forming cytoskeletal protein [Desulfarculales bacterium]
MASKISLLAAGTFIRGDIFSDDLLIIEGGIDGKVVGNKVIIKHNGWVQGEMACRSLLIELGGMLNGFVRVSSDPVNTFLAWSENQPIALPEVQPFVDTSEEANHK